MDNLDQYYRPKNSPITNPDRTMNSLDFNMFMQVPNGQINYANLDINTKPFRAVVSLSRTKGAFQDIQEAINYIHKNFSGGAILIKEGTYLPATVLTIYSNIYLVGETGTTVIIDFNNTTNNFVSDPAATGMNPVTNIGVENITFKNCHNTSQGTIYLENVDEAIFTKLNFTNNYISTSGYDFYLKDSSNIYINRILGISGTFLYTNNVYRLTINDVIATCSYRGIIGKSDGVGIIRGIITNCIFDTQYAAFYGTFQDVLYTNVDFSSSPASPTEPGVYILSSSEDILNGNFINCSILGSHEGALLDGSSASIESIRFTNCNISSGTGYDGIKLISANRTILTGNDLTGDVTGGHFSLNISNIGCTNTRINGNIYNNNVQQVGTNYNNGGTKTSS